MRGVIRGSGEKTVYLIDGKEVTRAEFKRAFPDRPLANFDATSITAWKKKLRSDALGVLTSQRSEALERNRKAGITGVDYDPKTGEAIFADRGARRALLRLEGCHDKSGGYGD